MISEKIKHISPSKTLEIGEKIKLLKSQNHKIFALNSGEPEYDTATHIKESAIKAIKEGFTKYTDVSGIQQLKLAIIDNIWKQQGIKYSLAEVIVSNGAKHVLFNLFMSTLNQGEEVVLVKPYWNSYADMINILGGKIKFFETSIKDDFQLDTKKLSLIISKKTKWLVLNYPNNPTGKTLSNDELQSLIEIMYKHIHINLVLDEVYNKIILDDKSGFKNILNLDVSLKNRIFLVNSVSKSYAMTGWRIGYGVGPSYIVNSMKIIQSHSTSNPSSIGQMAALEALKVDTDFMQDSINSWKRKLSIVKDTLDNIGEIKYHFPAGGFYIFPDFSNFIGYKTPNNRVIKDDFDLALFLLEFWKIAVVPGSIFGAPNHLRISFTIGFDQIKDAMENLRNAMFQLRQSKKKN